MESFAYRLRKARIAARMTQEQLGFELAITKSSVSAWENGRETPSFRMLQRLPAVVGCSLDYLLCVDGGGAEEAKDQQGSYQPVNCARDTAESRLLECFRRLSSGKKKALLDLLRHEK